MSIPSPVSTTHEVGFRKVGCMTPFLDYYISPLLHRPFSPRFRGGRFVLDWDLKNQDMHFQARLSIPESPKSPLSFLNEPQEKSLRVHDEQKNKK